jgi:hypothetical protein
MTLLAELFEPIEGFFGECGCAAIYLIRRLRRDGLSEIGKLFRLGLYSSASSVMKRMKDRMHHDRQLRKRIKALENQLKKSQA